ncbi:hypothetical protein LCGC14_3158120, partial [marine sediment metagenome]
AEHDAHSLSSASFGFSYHVYPHLILPTHSHIANIISYFVAQSCKKSLTGRDGRGRIPCMAWHPSPDDLRTLARNGLINLLALFGIIAALAAGIFLVGITFIALAKIAQLLLGSD